MDVILNEFVAALGEDGVVARGQELVAAETATFQTHHRVPLILRPANRDQVQACMRIAGKHGVSVYPVSSGKNWGYGSRVPTADSCAILDLGRMKRILDFNEELAYVTVEPGVTQGQLSEFLRERGSSLWMDSTGASPDCSLIGNTMERGFGHTPYGDHFANVCGLEVVLPTGECIETGFSRSRGAAAASVYRWGVGPSLDGLFSQSNFGIVTRMTVWLMPAPECFQAFFFKCEREEDIGPLVDAMRPLRIAGVLGSAVHIGNAYKVISGLQKYPWDRTGGTTPLQPTLLADLAREKNFGQWNGAGGLCGTRAQVAEAKRLLRKALKGKVSRLTFLDDRLLGLAERFSKTIRLVTRWDFQQTIELVRPIYDLLKGIPTDHPLRSTYWRKTSPIPEQMDPDRDRCGLVWCAPVGPLSGDHVTTVSRIACDVLLRWRFEPMLSVTLITGRAFMCVVSICYDRDVPGEDERALACYRELAREMLQRGYEFYRLGVHSMADFETSEETSKLLSRIKAAVDPHHTLAPGRYEPAPKESAALVS
jgi:4-cresol dehydrogenase (hydroxylating) flavoprotein subunit